MTAYDATSSKHISIQRRSAKVISDSNAAFIKHVMGMVSGRTYLYGLLDSCHVFAKSLFTPDALQTAYISGQHSVGQSILTDIMACCPDEYIQMMREANARELADDTRRSRSDADTNGDDSGSKPYVHPAFDGLITTRPTEDDDLSNVERDEADRDEGS